MSDLVYIILIILSIGLVIDAYASFNGEIRITHKVNKKQRVHLASIIGAPDSRCPSGFIYSRRSCRKMI